MLLADGISNNDDIELGAVPMTRDCSAPSLNGSGGKHGGDDDDADGREGAIGFVNRFGYLFREYKADSPWFAAVDMTVSIAIGILEGSRVNRAACAASGIVFLVIIVVYLVLVAWRRPFIAGANMLFAVTVSALQLAAGVAYVVGYYGAQPSMYDVSSTLSSISNALVLIRVACDLLVFVFRLWRRRVDQRGRDRERKRRQLVTDAVSSARAARLQREKQHGMLGCGSTDGDDIARLMADAEAAAPAPAPAPAPVVPAVAPSALHRAPPPPFDAKAAAAADDDIAAYFDAQDIFGPGGAFASVADATAAQPPPPPGAASFARCNLHDDAAWISQTRAAIHGNAAESGRCNSDGHLDDDDDDDDVAARRAAALAAATAAVVTAPRARGIAAAPSRPFSIVQPHASSELRDSSPQRPVDHSDTRAERFDRMGRPLDRRSFADVTVTAPSDVVVVQQPQQQPQQQAHEKQQRQPQVDPLLDALLRAKDRVAAQMIYDQRKNDTR